VRRSPLLDFLLADFPKLVRHRRLTRDGTNSNIRRPAQYVLVGKVVGSGNCLNTDDANTWVLWTTVVLAVTEITNPGLEIWAVVLPDELPAGLYRGDTVDGGPFTLSVDERDVDVRVVGQLIGLV
jgi:hypothetical protein